MSGGYECFCETGDASNGKTVVRHVARPLWRRVLGARGDESFCVNDRIGFSESLKGEICLFALRTTDVHIIVSLGRATDPGNITALVLRI